MMPQGNRPADYYWSPTTSRFLRVELENKVKRGRRVQKDWERSKAWKEQHKKEQLARAQALTLSHQEGLSA